MVEKIKPNASIEYNYGNDGRDGCYYVDYCCPRCKKHLNVGEIACVNCGTFFDWSSKAHIEIKRVIVWD
jgi:hypothetical protein